MHFHWLLSFDFVCVCVHTGIKPKTIEHYCIEHTNTSTYSIQWPDYFWSYANVDIKQQCLRMWISTMNKQIAIYSLSEPIVFVLKKILDQGF